MRVSTASTGLAARCGAASPSLRALCRPAAAPLRAASAAACVASSRHLPISSALLALLLRVQRAALLLGQLHGALDAPTRLECAEPTRACRLGACSRCARSSLVSGQGQGWGQWSRSGLESGGGVRVSSVDQLRLCPRGDARLLHRSDRRVDCCPAEVGSLRGHLPADPRASRWQAGEPSRVVRVALGGPRNLGRRVRHGV